MIILVIDVYRVTVVKAKRDAPVSTYTNGPSAFSIARERVQDEPGQIHVAWSDRDLKPAQYQTQTVGMLRQNPGFRALEKELLKSLVVEAADHNGIVTRYAAGYKTPNVQGNRRAALTLAENQGVRRRVRLTVRLGPGVRGSQYR